MKVTHVKREPYGERRIGNGAVVKIDIVCAYSQWKSDNRHLVSTTYRAKLCLKDGREFPCPTNFRSKERCRLWAKKEYRLLLRDKEIS